MPKQLKILMLEDNEADAEIVLRMLTKEKFHFESRLVADKRNFEKELDEFHPDLVLADNSLPQFNATEALSIMNKRELHIPFILITGTVSEEFAANIIKSGADDYILKDRLARLPAAIASALKYRRAEREKEETIAQLKDNEQKYRTLVERVSDGFIAMDPNWHLIYINPKAEELLGRPHDELIGKHFWAEFPEGVDKTFHKAYEQAMKTQENLYLKGYSYALSRWVETNIYPSPTGVSVFFRDISAQKKTEEDLQTAHNRLLFHIENAPLGFIEWDDHFQVRSWSIRAEEIFGWSEQEMKDLGKNGINMVFEEDQPALALVGEQILSGKLERHTMQNRNYTKDGNVIWCEWFNSVVKNKEGQVTTILSLVQDITQRKKTEAEIKSTTEQLRELSLHLQDIREEERAALSREVHDVLGQQLTSFKMDIHWVKKRLELPEKEVKEKMDSITHSIDDTIRIVRKIASDLRPSILDDLGLVAALEWHSEEFERRSGIKVAFRSNVGTIEIVPKIAIALFRIYQEIMTNVVRHAEAERVDASLFVERDKLHLQVTDNGKGFKLRSIDNKKTLGLLGMKERSVLLGGNYSIKSSPGKGTTVEVVMPFPGIE